MILKCVVQVSRLFILWLTHDPKLLPQIWPSENLCLKLSNSPRIFPQNKTSWSYCVSHHATWTVGDRGTFFITLVISKHDAMIWNAFLGLPVVSIIWWHTSGKSCFLNKQTSGVEFIQDTRRIHQSWSFFIFTCIKTLSSSHFNCFFLFSKISSIRLWLNAYRRHRLKTNLSTFAGTMDVDVASFRFLQSLRPKKEIPWPSKQTNISCTLVISERKLCNPQNVFF